MKFSPRYQTCNADRKKPLTETETPGPFGAALKNCDVGLQVTQTGGLRARVLFDYNLRPQRYKSQRQRMT